MFERNIEEGALQIGQVSALINEIKPAGEIISDIISGYNETLNELTTLD